MVLAGAASLTLAWAAASDVRRRLIPNTAILVLLAIFVAWAAMGLGPPVLSAIEAAAIAFVVTVALYAFKIVGAGDSKLFAVAALFFGMSYLPMFALATVLAGGVIALISLVSRPRRAAVMLSMGGKGDWGRGVPYGVAIAIGALVVLWGGMTGYVAPYRFGKPAPVTTRDIARTFAAPTTGR